MTDTILDPTVFTTLIVNLEPYSLYDVQVAAVNDAGLGPRSLEATIETPKASQYPGDSCVCCGYTYASRGYKEIRLFLIQEYDAYIENLTKNSVLHLMLLMFT